MTTFVYLLFALIILLSSHLAANRNAFYLLIPHLFYLAYVAPNIDDRSQLLQAASYLVILVGFVQAMLSTILNCCWPNEGQHDN